MPKVKSLAIETGWRQSMARSMRRCYYSRGAEERRWESARGCRGFAVVEARGRESDLATGRVGGATAGLRWTQRLRRASREVSVYNTRHTNRQQTKALLSSRDVRMREFFPCHFFGERR